MFDMIGDIHGHADALERLLLKRSLTKLYLQTYSPATMVLNRCLLAITG